MEKEKTKFNGLTLMVTLLLTLLVTMVFIPGLAEKNNKTEQTIEEAVESESTKPLENNGLNYYHSII